MATAPLIRDGDAAGKTRPQGDANPNEPAKGDDLVLSFENLQRDFLAFIAEVFPEPSQSPDFVLLGHSMGASPIISSAPLLQSKGYKVVGVVILDVVEGG